MTDSFPPNNNTPVNPVRNIIIALVAIALTISVFLGLHNEKSGISLESQAKDSLALDVALNNHKPTLLEFYANWCTSCQAIAPQMANLKQEYNQKVNFVMLNVDNSKWLPEILKYRVDGIPHFVYINDQGETIAEAIGEQPLTIMRGDLDSLIANQPLTHTPQIGKVSNFKTES
jgi:thiol-disulfide isomerase/thioredoxin